MLVSIFLLVFALTSPALSDSDCPWLGSDLHLWSEDSTWGDHGLPVDGEEVVIEQHILLDTYTARLDRLTIRNGGSLVFSPDVELAKLTVGVVKIEEDGALLIGGPDCRFPGRAEVLLLGEAGQEDSSNLVKGIFVELGGTLEIHGEEKLAWTKLTATLLKQSGVFDIQLAEEPLGWKMGDKLVIASTDYVKEQAEVVEVVDCPPCQHQLSCTCSVAGEVNFMHYGEIYKGLNMQAEVGLLTRNVLIHGEVADEEDRFGGHIKAFRGFRNFRIRGAELTRMGQYGIKGRYPIHWHMAHSVEDRDTYAKENAIHDVFQRCVTVHGTHGARVERNVAYKTYGHCYFLEDGGERNTTLAGNLGLLTRAGITIPSDRRPATFWITSPLTVMTDNAAAGSDGVGIWYIFGRQVTGPSADQGFFEEGEAFKTQILTMARNTAHSNGYRGFFFGDELTWDQDFANSETNQCDPREDPLDKWSPSVSNLVQDLTLYKNMQMGLWNDCKNVIYDGLKISDTPFAMVASHTPCTVQNSLFIGESGNLGEPNEVRLRNGTKVMWHRSTPYGLHHQGAVLGIHFYDGYVYASHNTFTDFYDDAHKIAGAISFKAMRSIRAEFKHSFFDFEDGLEGNYVKGLPKYSFGAHKSEYRGLAYDIDGTITGWPGTTIVPDRPFFASSLCESRPHWGNMSVCPHTYASIRGAWSLDHGNYIVTRDDLGRDVDPCLSGGDSPCHYHVGAISVDHSYIVAPATYTWDQIDVRIGDLPEGDLLRVGVCFPLNSTITVSGTPEPQEVDSMEQLMEDTSGSGYFVDHEVGVLFRRFRGAGGEERGVQIVVTELVSEDVDCTTRAYPKYQVPPL